MIETEQFTVHIR